MAQLDRETLEAALVGYRGRLSEIDSAMAGIRRDIAGGAAVTSNGTADKPKRKMSAAARKRIADAQKKRWAKVHAAKQGQ